MTSTRSIPRCGSTSIRRCSTHAGRITCTTISWTSSNMPPSGLRRHLRERASLERLRPDAVAQPDRRVAGAAHERHRDLRDGQQPRALQSADAGGRRVRHDRLHLRRPPDCRLPRGLADGHLLRLRPEPEPVARALLRGARPGEEGVDREGHLRLLTAASTSSATSTSGRGRSRTTRIRRSGSPAAARSRPGAGARRWTTSTATCRTTATRPG